jgi:hypothetical protein
MTQTCALCGKEMKEFWCIEIEPYDPCEFWGPFETQESAEQFAQAYPAVVRGPVQKVPDFMGYMWSPTTWSRHDVWVEHGHIHRNYQLRPRQQKYRFGHPV